MAVTGILVVLLPLARDWRPWLAPAIFSVLALLTYTLACRPVAPSSLARSDR
jgi:hypothetical protein